jgi:hypothetical protein
VTRIIGLVASSWLAAAPGRAATVDVCGPWDQEGGAGVKIVEADGIVCVGSGPPSLEFCDRAGVERLPITAVRTGRLDRLDRQDREVAFREVVVRRAARDVATIRIYDLFPAPSAPEVVIRRAEIFGGLAWTDPLPSVDRELMTGEGYCVTGEDGGF